MNPNNIVGSFEAMGARVQLRSDAPRFRWDRRNVLINVHSGHRGEYFWISHDPEVKLQVVDLRPRQKHLLLAAGTETQKDRFLCGRDEQHWFVAAVPRLDGAKNVRTAMDALKPHALRRLEQIKDVPVDLRYSRRNDAFVRQGEWFFVPAPFIGSEIASSMVLHNEPIRRGLGKPHHCQFLYRRGGTEMYVSRTHHLSPLEYRAFLSHNPEARKWGWRKMQLDATVYVRGNISHPDHATIHLPVWHRVMMNAEGTLAPANRWIPDRAESKVLFLD